MTPEETTEEVVEDQQASLTDDIESALDEQTTEAPEIIEAEPEPEPLVAVERWNQGLKDMFSEWGGIDNGRAYQQSMLDYHKEQQGYHTKLEQELSPLRTESESWNGVFQPHQEFMMHNGLTPHDAARRGVGIMANIADNPQSFALDVLKRLNYDFASHGQDDPYVPPEVLALQKEISDMRQGMQRNTQQTQNNQVADMTKQIESFKGATSESGELLHPHYQEVESAMAMAVHGYRGMGQPIPPIAKLYEDACLQNTDIQSQSRSNEVAKETARKSAAAKKAKDAAARPSGKHTGETSSSTLRADLEAEYDNLAA